MSEFSELVKSHPLLVLTNTKPHVWHGLVNINKYKNIEIRLKVPKYPLLQDTTVEFGDNHPFINEPEFFAKMPMLFRHSDTLLTFLKKLQALMEEMIQEKVTDLSECNWSHRILKELMDVFEIDYVKVAVNDNLTKVKLTYRDISIYLSRCEDGQVTWRLDSTDLPDLSQYKTFDKLENCISTLSEAAKALTLRTNILIDTWETLEEIDSNCHILDPANPKPSHLYRRIYINSSVSILISLDPLEPKRYKDIKVFGTEEEVNKYCNIMNSNIHKWSESNSAVENLLDIFELDEWPRYQPADDSDVVSGGIFNEDTECCICFLTELEDEDGLPSATCNNSKCKSLFHRSCLAKWLQSDSNSTYHFNRIYGKCPGCSNEISCLI